MIARVKFWLALRKRKAIRKVEQQRAKQAYWAAQRKAWAQDPLRCAA